MILGRKGASPRIKVKCSGCGIIFTVPQSVYRTKTKNNNQKMFHNRKCYTDWTKSKNNEVKKQMYKKGRPPSLSTVNIEGYILRMMKYITPHIKNILIKSKSNFVNTRELDDMLCDEAKGDRTLVDGKNRWIEIHRSVRVRVISKTLVDNFGYVVWSGNTRKVFCKPSTPPSFKKASDIKKEGGFK